MNPENSNKSHLIYASPLMKGWEIAQAVQSFKAQEHNRETARRIMNETEVITLCRK